MKQTVRWTKALAAIAAGVLLAPVAQAQVADLPCGSPPKPVRGSIAFSDISNQIGYQPLAAPSTDTLSDFYGGEVGGGNNCYDYECYSQNGQGDFFGPYASAHNLATVSLPFPFGFSGIYADGGAANKAFQVNVWSNGLLTFDPSVSFDPTGYGQNSAPSDCQIEGCGSRCGQGNLTQDMLQTTAVANIFGGFPFQKAYSPPNIPNSLIAPWWGDLSICPNFGQVGWLLTLDDDNKPMAVIQWMNLTASPPQTATACPGNFSGCSDTTGALIDPSASLPRFSFQVRLHENNDVDFVYGPSSNTGDENNCFVQATGTCTYVSGVQSNLIFPNAVRPPLLNYSSQALNCNATTGCSQNQFPSGTSETFHDVFRSIAPDLQIVSISPPGQVPQGGSIVVPTSITNGGGSASTGQGTLQFYFSAGGTTPVGNPFSAQSVPVYQACSTNPFQAHVTIPAGVPQGGGYLIAEFVPGTESVDQNHSFAYAAVVVGPEEADVAMIGSATYSPAAVIGGQQISLSFQAQNVGEVDAPSVAYGVYLSLGGSISPNDPQIGGGVIQDLAPGAALVTISGNYTIPLTVVSGEYTLGVMLNPTGTLKEVNQTNNVAIGPKLLSVTSPGPVIVTSKLRNAQANSPYSIQLIAGGGDGKYQWSLNAGTLPAGLALTKTGLINGQAENAGTNQFQVKLTDGLGHSTTATLTLGVDPFTQALTIVTPSLPAGSTAQLYNFTVAAIGGQPPYQWALVPGAGTPPTGINLLGNGLLTGEPQYDGFTSFQMTVTDSVGTVVTSPSYTLTVFAAGTLAVGSTTLPPATLNKTYSATLHYAGGSGPYTWTLIDVQREPNAPGDPGEDLGPNLPASSKIGSTLLTWFPREGQIEGKPSVVGVYALTVQVTDAEVPPASATGLVLLTISSSDNFSFTTVQLPQATTNEFYSTQLVTTETNPDDIFCELLNTSLLPTDTAKLTVPPGLQLYSNCQISGVALEQGSFPFTVEATDTQGGLATQSFSIQVANALPTKSGGCQSGAGAPALAGLLLLALSGIRRRRR